MQKSKHSQNSFKQPQNYKWTEDQEIKRYNLVDRLGIIIYTETDNKQRKLVRTYKIIHPAHVIRADKQDPMRQMTLNESLESAGVFYKQVGIPRQPWQITNEYIKKNTLVLSICMRRLNVRFE